MTPTNDAPERGMDRIMRYVAMREAMPMRQSGDVIHAIHAGTEWEAELRLSDLAALASATAGDGVEGALRNLVALYDSDEGCQSLPEIVVAKAVLDRPHSAVAPAGDGLVEAAFKEGIATGYQCGKAEENTTDEWHAAWLASDASVAAALARARAAVGSEYNGGRCTYCDGTGDVHRIDGEWLGECPDCKPKRAAVGERMEALVRSICNATSKYDILGADLEAARSILAELQAPPAKVEE